jgi:hypothetical protein
MLLKLTTNSCVFLFSYSLVFLLTIIILIRKLKTNIRKLDTPYYQNF